MSRILLAAGALLFALALVLALTFRPAKNAVTVTVGVLGRSTTTTRTVTAPKKTTTAKAPAPAPPPSVPFSWSNAGALIVHPADVDPAWLAQQMRAAGFGWVALDLDPAPDPGWIARF